MLVAVGEGGIGVAGIGFGISPVTIGLIEMITILDGVCEIGDGGGPFRLRIVRQALLKKGVRGLCVNGKREQPQNSGQYGRQKEMAETVHAPH